MEDWERMRNDLAEKLISKDSILSVLKCLSNNIHLSYTNLLLVADKRPEAKNVCGRKAWEQLGRALKPDAVLIQILFPHVRDGFFYQPVNVYDYDSTIGPKRADIRALHNPADKITYLTGATWEMLPGSIISSSLEKGYYDQERNVFCITESAAKEQEHQTELSLYIDYVLLQRKHSDKLLRMAVMYVVYEYFGCKNTMVNALFGKLGKFSAEEKLCFFKEVQLISRQVIEELTTYTLSFNETAYLNELLQSDDLIECCHTCRKTAESVEKEDIQAELFALAEKLENCEKWCFQEICRRRAEKALFTFPPIVLQMKEKDVLELEGSHCYE